MKTYDAIVIGSGATGGWAAKQLCEGGMEVLMLDAGRMIDPSKEFQEHTWPYQLPFRGFGKPGDIEVRQRSASRFASEFTTQFYVNDADLPYTTPEAKPFNWIRARNVGGRTLAWGRQTYRLSNYDLQAATHDGFGQNWPIRYEELAPYYDIVESFIGVSGRAEGYEALPDGKFLPPMNFSCGEMQLKKVVDAYGDRIMTIGRAAILTERHEGRAACHWCGHCGRGCMTGSYFSTPSSTLPAAVKTKKLTLQTNAIARQILMGKNGKARGVVYIDGTTGKHHEVNAKIVMLNASTLESTRLLMLSKLGGQNDALGHYLVDHTIDCRVLGFLPASPGKITEFDDNRANGLYIPRFRNLKTRHPDYIRGWGYQGEAIRGIFPTHAAHRTGFGADFKKSVREDWPYATRLWAFGEMLARRENFVRLDETVKDKWGIPELHIECVHSDNEIKMMKDAVDTAQEMMHKAGAEIYDVNYTPSAPGTCVHELGTARMGTDPKTSVLNQWNQVWDVPNLFVTDGAAFPSSGCVNPTLTMMAMTVRACEHILERSKRREI
jgi:choline dehydrogenase-like flavoprotein